MKQRKQTDRPRLLFFGTPNFAVPTFKTLLDCGSCTVSAVVTQPDKPAGRGKKLRESPVKVLAREHHIPILTPISISNELTSFLLALKQFEPVDLGIVIAFGQIIPPEILDIPMHGCVNLHASLLPRWRGAAPLQRAILAGDNESGVCLMQMEAGLDTGPILAQKRLPLDSTADYGIIHDLLAQISADLIRDNLAALLRGDLKSTPQPSVGLSYAKKIRAEELKIDWSQQAEKIERQIRAFSPEPGAYTIFRNKRLKILSARVKPAGSILSDAQPGTVVFVDGHSCEILCTGGGILALEKVKLEGRREMPIKEFLKGVDLGALTFLS